MPAVDCRAPNGFHHELLLTSPGRRIDIIKQPIKAGAGAFIAVICEGPGFNGVFVALHSADGSGGLQPERENADPLQQQHTRG